MLIRFHHHHLHSNQLLCYCNTQHLDIGRMQGNTPSCVYAAIATPNTSTLAACRGTLQVVFTLLLQHPTPQHCPHAGEHSKLCLRCYCNTQHLDIVRMQGNTPSCVYAAIATPNTSTLAACRGTLQVVSTLLLQHPTPRHWPHAGEHSKLCLRCYCNTQHLNIIRMQGNTPSCVYAAIATPNTSTLTACRGTLQVVSTLLLQHPTPRHCRMQGNTPSCVYAAIATPNTSTLAACRGTLQVVFTLLLQHPTPRHWPHAGEHSKLCLRCYCNTQHLDIDRMQGNTPKLCLRCYCNTQHLDIDRMQGNTPSCVFDNCTSLCCNLSYSYT